MPNKKLRSIALLVLGVILGIWGLILIRNVALKKWSGVLIVLGTGLLGMSIAELITLRVIEKNSALKQQTNIQATNERDIQINNVAKAKTFDFNQFLALPAFLILILAGASVRVMLLITGLYLGSWAVYIWNLHKAINEM